MDSTKVMSLLETLDDEVDDLEESLAPLLKTALSESTSKLPLLDKAKLYVLVTYAIESLLFSYLRLNGVKAREHPVFRELTRVKQYFDKIKEIETPAQRTLVVDKGAAARIIKAGLAGNDKYDLKRAEMEAKLPKRHIRFLEDSNKKQKHDPIPVDEKSESESESESSDSSEASVKVEAVRAKPPKKKKKLG